MVKSKDLLGHTRYNVSRTEGASKEDGLEGAKEKRKRSHSTGSEESHIHKKEKKKKKHKHESQKESVTKVDALERLRQERLLREMKESKRSAMLVEPVLEGAGANYTSWRDRHQRFNNQFNPLIAKQNTDR